MKLTGSFSCIVTLLVTITSASPAHSSTPPGLPPGVATPSNAANPANAAFLKTFTAMAAKNPKLAAALVDSTQATLAQAPANSQPAAALDGNVCRDAKPGTAKPTPPDAIVPAHYTSAIKLKNRLKGEGLAPSLQQAGAKIWTYSAVAKAKPGKALANGKPAPLSAWPVSTLPGVKFTAPPPATK